MEGCMLFFLLVSNLIPPSEVLFHMDEKIDIWEIKGFAKAKIPWGKIPHRCNYDGYYPCSRMPRSSKKETGQVLFFAAVYET